jgi:ABC-type nitrate/sulfonate/bicarbonate transport system substrate-binding protein
MKKAVWVLAIIGVLFVGSLSVAAETYNIAMLPDVGWSYYQVAEVKGLWEKQGISVKLVEYMSPFDLLHSAIQRRIDFLPIPMAVIVDIIRESGGTDITYLGTFSISDQHKYLLLKNDLINEPLKGQTIGVFLNDTTNRFLLSTYLNSVNTKLADVQLVEMSTEDLEANFIHNRLQAMLGINLSDLLVKFEKADGAIALSTQEFYEPHGLVVVKKGGLTVIPPDDLKKILRGCVEALVWIRDPANWDEYKAILTQYCFPDSPDLSDDQIRALTKVAKFVDPQTLLEHNQQKLHDYFTQFRAFLADEGNLETAMLNHFTYENIITNQALIEVLQEFVK